MRHSPCSASVILWRRSRARFRGVGLVASPSPGARPCRPPPSPARGEGSFPVTHRAISHVVSISPVAGFFASIKVMPMATSSSRMRSASAQFSLSGQQAELWQCARSMLPFRPLFLLQARGSREVFRFAQRSPSSKIQCCEQHPDIAFLEELVKLGRSSLAYSSRR